MRYRFLVETYETERIKTLGVWSQFRDADHSFRPEPRARTPHEHMVHQCLSEEAWMRGMLGIQVDHPALPEREVRLEFIRHYAEVSAARQAALADRGDEWFEASTTFFGTPRSRAWVLVRRVSHTAHHRGQLTVYLRLLGLDLYSTYGPTADTGGLFQNQAPVIYRYADVETLLRHEERGGGGPPLPGPGDRPVTERPTAERNAPTKDRDSDQ